MPEQNWEAFLNEFLNCWGKFSLTSPVPQQKMRVMLKKKKES